MSENSDPIFLTKKYMINLLYYQYTMDWKPAIKFKCPACGEWGTIDDDQFNGRISILHEPGCGWHQTVNLKVEGREVERPTRV